LVGVAVNVTDAPEHVGLEPPVTAIETAAVILQGAIWYEKIRVRAALVPVVPPINSLVLQKVTPSVSRH
jgi:hypothetical protein